MSQIKIVVPGGLNTDLIASGVPRLAGAGELVVGRKLEIGPGGKSRNIAQMIATLTGPGTVAMIGRTVKDPFGLWEVPVQALRAAGVNLDYVHIGAFAGKLPGVALIPVDQAGNNQIYLLPGVNNDFSEKDISNALPAFKFAQENSGLVALSLELPLATALATLDLANGMNLPVVLDPGGIQEGLDYNGLFQRKIFLIKPNEHEAEILTGSKVADFESATEAARILRQKGVANILITAGESGAYLFTPETALHIATPHISTESAARDATGCGDQTMATICAMLAGGKEVIEAARLGIISGTLQFYKAGITPVTSTELSMFSRTKLSS